MILQMITNVNSNILIGGDICMPAQWTGEIIGEMHIKNVKAKDLAKVLGWHPKYLSAVLNGHREPKNAEQIIRDALRLM